MAMTLDELTAMLDDIGIKKRERRDDDVIFGFGTESYRAPNGAEGILLVAQLDENGEYFQVYAPMAFKVKPDHQEAFLKACMMIQWKTKLIQFEFDASDGEIRPVIEFPLEDNKLTRKQLARCIGGLCQIVDRYYTVLNKANDTGEVDFEETEATSEREVLERRLDELQRRLAELDGNGSGNGPSRL